jgi:arylsulfatase A-like enzyme
LKIPIPPIPPARRRLAWLPLLASAVSAFAAAPNIVFILADDLGYGDVGALNPQGKIATPQLDRLASRGMVFTEAHSTSAVCSPSRYSILTGRYNWRSELKSGVLGGFNRPLIEPGRLTVAQMLRAHGYHTAVFGKWHLGLDWVRRAGNSVVPVSPPDNAGAPVDFSKPFGGGPTTLGFDEFFGISASLDMPPYAFLANDRVTSLPAADQRFSWTGIGHAVKYTRSGPTAPDFDPVEVLPAIRQHAVEYVGAHAAEARAGHPFFLYLPLNSPHTPIAPTKAWRAKSGLNDYADFVMETDAAIGEVLVALERAGVADNTLVLFASDNGCSPEADFPFWRRTPTTRARRDEATRRIFTMAATGCRF